MAETRNTRRATPRKRRASRGDRLTAKETANVVNFFRQNPDAQAVALGAGAYASGQVREPLHSIRLRPSGGGTESVYVTTGRGAEVELSRVWPPVGTIPGGCRLRIKLGLAAWHPRCTEEPQALGGGLCALSGSAGGFIQDSVWGGEPTILPLHQLQDLHAVLGELLKYLDKHPEVLDRSRALVATLAEGPPKPPVKQRAARA